MSLKLRATGPAGTCPIVDEEMVRRALAVFADPERPVQVVGHPHWHHYNGHGNDVDHLFRGVRALSRESRNIYMILNPLLRAIEPTPKVKGGGRAGASSVAYRRWLFVDVDPLKPPEHEKDPATDEEHDRTRQAAEEIRDWLSSQGWPAPILVDSGNGWYLIYRTELEHTVSVQSIIREWLRGLLERVKDKAKIDRAVHNADRLVKLPGTLAQKGTCSEDRPYRPCRLVFVPNELERVTAEMILAATPRQEKNGHVAMKKGAFILKAGSGAATAYWRKALDNECARVACCRASSGEYGGRNGQLNTAAFNLGSLIGGGYGTREEAESRLREAARANGSYDDGDNGGERGVEATIRSGIEAGIKSPRIITSDRAPAVEDAPPVREEVEESEEWELCIDEEVIAAGDSDKLAEPLSGLDEGETKATFQILTLPTLLGSTFPPPAWVVPGILSEGLNILAGKPKMGKSIMALNLGISVSGGGMALGNAAVEQGDVLYLALEDKFRRLQARARKMALATGQKVSSSLHLATSWPRIHLGGLKLIDRWIAKTARPRLVIIDVWPMFKPSSQKGRSAYDEDYEALGLLKKFCDKRSVNCLILLHCRKGPSEDVLDEVSGTLGQVGAADGILVLNRSRRDGESRIFVAGRDVDEQELSLSFDLPTLTWKSMGPASEHIEGKLQTAIIEYLKGHSPAFAKDIALSVDAIDGSVRKVLSRLLERYIVRRVGNAWSYPGEPPDEEVI